MDQSNFGASKSVSWCKYERSAYCWIFSVWFTDILAQVTKGSFLRNGEMQWIIFFFQESELGCGFVALSISDMGSWGGAVSCKGPGPNWAAGAYMAHCGDAVVRAKLCTVDD